MSYIKDLKIEIFKPIYIDGELTKYMISDYGKCINTKTNKEVKAWIGKKGTRLYLTLYHHNKAHTKQVARWMALSFLELPDGVDYSKYDADHIDEDPMNNYLENIQWLTKENNRYKSNLPSTKKYIGEVCVDSKLKNEDVHSLIKDFLYNDISYSDAAKKYNISMSTICDIMNGRTWKTVYSQYDMSNYIKRKRNAFTKDQIKMIKKYSKKGYSSYEIANKMNLENSKLIRERIRNFM